MVTFKKYLLGFIISIALTAAAFVPVFQHVHSGHHAFSHEFLTYWVIVIALLQALVQLVFFLHLTHTSRWNKVVFASTVSIILILVIGSIWIMGHLNYNMTPQDMDKYMMQTEGMGK